MQVTSPFVNMLTYIYTAVFVYRCIMITCYEICFDTTYNRILFNYIIYYCICTVCIYFIFMTDTHGITICYITTRCKAETPCRHYAAAPPPSGAAALYI